MKKFLCIFLCLTGSFAFAQVRQSPQNPQSPPNPQNPQSQQSTAVKSGPAIRLHGYALYAFDDKVDSYYSTTSYFNGTIKGGFEYGGGLEVLLSPAQGIEVTYLRLDSEAPMEYYDDGVEFTTFDLASNYILLSGNRYLVVNPKIEPYAGLQAGMVVFNLKNPDSGATGSSTKFAWGLRAGINIWASEKVGIKLQAGLVSAVQSVGGGFYFGTGGAGAGVSSYSSFYQFNLGGGLVFNLKGR
jgi:hypothetical protein